MRNFKRYLALLAFVFSGNCFAQLQPIDLDFATLKQEFTMAQDKTIILSVLGVNCPPCRTHRDDIKNEIMNKCDNPNIQWLIVWFEDPAHPATRSSAVSQASLVTDSRVKQWWFTEHQPSTPKNDSICYKMGKASWFGCFYPWDISMLFDKGIKWTGTNMPTPSYCMSKTGCCNSFSIAAFKTQIDNINRCDSSANVSVPERINLNPSVQIIPNPATADIHFQMNSDVTINEVTIYNLTGEKIFSQTGTGDSGNFNMNVSDWEMGLYIVQIQTNVGILSKRLMVN